MTHTKENKIWEILLGIKHTHIQIRLSYSN